MEKKPVPPPASKILLCSTDSIKEIREASREAKRLKKSYILSKLNEHQRVIYEILEKKMRMGSGKLYNEYASLVLKPVVARAYRNHMKKMVNLG